MKFARRNILKIGLGIGGATVGFLFPGGDRLFNASRLGRSTGFGHEPVGAQAMPGTARSMDGPDPGFAMGEVVSKTPDGVVLKADTLMRAVRFPPGAVVWKETYFPPDIIQLHDWLDVRGTPQADGSLLARSEWAWVNIGRLDGTVSSVSPAGLTVTTMKGAQTIELSPVLELRSVKDPTNDTPLVGGVLALKSGIRIGAVGLRLPGGGFRATRIWTPDL